MRIQSRLLRKVRLQSESTRASPKIDSPSHRSFPSVRQGGLIGSTIGTASLLETLLGPGDKLLYVQLWTSFSIAGHTFCRRAR
jgi:hypothetical protein